ncbi:ZYBA0S05-02630g1_1 [Zygosaccharomyces bailii CLIB 213]|uniref:ZYBA0S05-02630g1_1 n=1 Tax=Zygosaccharomyces bailii (strain CLIB 213 / ATCC 58445 / CBS 680 / BCRC 21525 / NBRC 1098 / NCYC 1416 / NRRL Y-2227) TaxID=1333698 RepID=A0A8J2T7A2_ZYGB2|nr:ZYBA0S05-02630g1_1 [Zygosaccharomyces bailii CLIB 213]
MVEEYLEPGFDPRSLKVAQLRRVLTENEVEFPSHSKKALLVRLFEERVAPQVPQLRKKYSRMSPSDEDIVQVRTRSSMRVKSEEGSDDSKSHHKKSRKRRGTEEDTKDAEGDVEMDQRRPKSSRGKRRKRIGEGEHTPITEKVAKKSPHKSPRKSLIIEKFESSDSSSDASSISNHNVDSPDLSKLKVSDAFSEQLRIALNHNGEQRDDYSKPDQTETATATVATSEDGAEDTFRSLKYEPLARISTPELPTSRQVEESEERVERVGKQIAQQQVDVKLEEPPLEAAVKGQQHQTRKQRQRQKRKQRQKQMEASSPKPKENVQEHEKEREDEQEEIEEETQQVKERQGKAEEQPQEEEYEEQIAEREIQTRARNRHRPLSSVSCGAIKRAMRFTMKTLYNLLLFSVIVLPTLFGLWYREQRILLGYCGSELDPLHFPSPTWNRLETHLPKPSCLQCPENALCYPYMQIKCKPEYALKRNPWSLYGLLPLRDSCLKDSKREKLIAEVVKKSLEFLRVKNARVSCGECDDDIKSGMIEEELYQIFYESKAPWINDEEFDELWTQAVADLKKEPEITWRQVSTTEFLINFEIFAKIFDTNSESFLNQLPESEHRSFRDPQYNTRTDGLSWKERHIPKAGNQIGVFRSTSKKYIGLRCKFEREIYQTCYKNRYLIGASSFGAILAKVVEFKLRKFLKEREKVDKLTKRVIHRLKSAKKSKGEGPKFLSTVQLRDVFLSDEVDLKYKNHLWQQTARKLELNNTNVKSSLIEIHGEIMKCWEWIGPLEEDSEEKETSSN